MPDKLKKLLSNIGTSESMNHHLKSNDKLYILNYEDTENYDNTKSIIKVGVGFDLKERVINAVNVGFKFKY